MHFVLKSINLTFSLLYLLSRVLNPFREAKMLPCNDWIMTSYSVSLSNFTVGTVASFAS